LKCNLKTLSNAGSLACGHKSECLSIKITILNCLGVCVGVLSAGSGEEPRVLAIQRPCGPEHEGFCFKGACSYFSDLDTPICRCDKMFSGMRCEHAILDTHQLSSPEEVIGISCGVVLILGSIIGLMYCCLKKRCQKSSPPYKNYGSENSV
uniref:Epithelial mitogen homolog (mouse) n=1 Tax=Cyprinus carpio TaxID=7962 RepID=A0A8C2D311_CYPCA